LWKWVHLSLTKTFCFHFKTFFNLNVTTLCEFANLAMSTLNVLKMEWWVCFQHLQFITCLLFLHNLNLKNKNSTLSLDFPNHELSFKFIFWSRPIKFPSTMMPCKCHLKLGWVGFGSWSKTFSPIFYSTNKIAPFCWIFI
jgi:hypothetical protein